tara:strand:- start:1426 stop:3183 length:1758 start_codon:yes stop_codon:yes gene_type:complete
MTVLDPKVYMANQAAFNQQAETQRTNQARENFKNFTPDIEKKSAGLELGAQPKTRSMIRKNVDGSYGTDTGLDELNKTGKITGNKVGLIDPNKAPPPSEAAMKINYNQYQNTVDDRFKNAELTGLTPNIFGSSWGRTIDSLAGDKDYLLNADGEPISGTGAIGRAIFGSMGVNEIDEYQTKKAIAAKINSGGFVEGIKDVDTYLEYGQPNMKPGPAADELQSRINKERMDRLSTTLDFTKDERKELDRVNKITDSTKKNEARITIAKKIDVRRQREILNKIKNMPEGPVKRANLEEFKSNLRASIIEDEVINVKQSDGSFQAMPKILAEIEGIQNTTDPREITSTFQNVTLSSANDTVRMAVQKRDEIVRQANIAKSRGNEKEFNQLKSQLSALDNGIVLAQGMQGLNDLDVGDTRRLSATLSNSLGRNIQITPRDDNLFTVTGLTGETKTMSAADIKLKARPIFDQAYKKQLTEMAMADRNKILENELEIKKELIKGTTAYNQAIAVEREKRITELKKKGFTITETEQGTLIQKDGDIGILDIREGKDPLGVDAEFLYIKSINPGELGSGLPGLSVSDYISETQ